MAKRRMGKRIYREPTADQAAKYRRIREMIADEIPEIKAEARAIRQGRQAKIGEAIRLLKAERELRGLSLADIGERTGLSKSAISKLEDHRTSSGDQAIRPLTSRCRPKTRAIIAADFAVAGSRLLAGRAGILFAASARENIRFLRCYKNILFIFP